MKRIGKNPTRAQARGPNEFSYFPVVINGPHSNEICAVLEALKEAQAKGGKALHDAVDKVDLNVLLSKFEENHAVVNWSRQHRLENTDPKISARHVPGDVHRDNKGEPTLEITEAAVWIGPPALSHPSTDEEFADGKGRMIARTYWGSKKPNWVGGVNNPPQIIGVDKAAKAEYQEFLKEERAQGIDIAATASQREMTEESEAVTGGSAKVPSLRKPTAPKTTPPASS